MKNYTITVNGNVYEVSVEENNSGVLNTAATQLAAAQAPMAPQAATPVAKPVTKPASAPQAKAATGAAGSVKVVAPMPGKILGIKVSAGQTVKKGDVVVILEAMKMENEIVAPEDGTVASVNASVGQTVETGEVLATLN